MDQDKSNQGTEEKKLKLEESKFKWDNGFKWATILLSTVGAAVGVATYVSNDSRDTERLRLDAQKQEAELQLKADDLQVKRSELQREQDSLRVKFLQDNINLILSPDPESDLKLNALAKIAFRENADGVIKQVADMRLRLPHEQPTSNDLQTNAVSASAEPEQDSPVPPLIIKPSPEMASKVEQGESDLAEGRAYVSRGDFKSALNSFSKATLNNPTNPLAWNFKAYAEFRTKQFDVALDSVTRAWKLKPVENRTRRFVAINATKILCAQGRADEAVTFFNKSAAVVPDIVADVYGDTEFQSTCKSIWKG